MTGTAPGLPVAAALGLITAALEVYGDDPPARSALVGYRTRLEEPLRVAIAGMVKAGKSTLLNAIIGEEIAPTDAGECTRVVTWYRHGITPRVTLHRRDGSSLPLPVTRGQGRLVLDLAGTPAEDVDRLVVEWPSARLGSLTLIDTPGIASVSGATSARSLDFLTPEDAPSQADAVVYLLRHLHAADLTFLEAFRDTGVGRSGTVNALAVLSRADEIGAGRIDALMSARNVAERYRRDGSLRALALGVQPVAGLLAQSARTLRESEFSAFAQLAALDRDARERLLVSADRFVRPTDQVEVSPELRRSLLARFGLFGIRLACVLVRSGVPDSSALSAELTRHSGLDPLLRSLADQFQARADQLKARTALIGVETLVREQPRAGAERLSAMLERIQAGAHEFAELRLLSEARTAGIGLSRERAEEAERLIGGAGSAPAARVGLPEDAPAGEIEAAAVAALRRWRTLAENPLTARAVAEVCRIVARSCEGIIAGVRSGGPEPVLLAAPGATTP
ncbi:dynamin family protein [Naasia aerilata]|uniref:GTPase n=1 Tax=Naasia aerilata TaxID=1162966 RepID=A0ABM8GEL1_9MICO|nr:dynamin family protein [Naasia aerilata]BDZ46767.1 GTPase [Naasia aerilata]